MLSLLLRGERMAKRVRHAVAGSEDSFDRDLLWQLSPKLHDFCGEMGTTPRPLNIVFLPMACDNSRFYIVEALMAVALRRRGHQVRFILCDRGSRQCSMLIEQRRDRWQDQCQKCYQRHASLYTATGIECETFSSLDSDSRWSPDLDEDDEATVRSSLLRQLQCGDEQLLKDHPERLESFRQTARQTKRVAESLARRGVDVAVMPDGLYEKYGILLNEFRRRGIATLVHGRGRRQRREGFAWNRPVSDWAADHRWPAIAESPLRGRQREEIEKYLQTRVDQTGEVLAYTFGGAQSPSEIRQRLGFDDLRPLDLMLPNLLWDANTVGRHRAFDGQVSWVHQTVRWYADNPDRNLCIKCHPAEELRGSQQTVASIARDAGCESLSNVGIIGASDTFHSHSVLAAADRGLVYTGTTGLEMAVMGKPVIVAGQTHYGEKGFTHHPVDRGSYLAALAEHCQPLGSDQVELAKKYFWLWACVSQVPWPFFQEAKLGHVAEVRIAQIKKYGEHPTIVELIAEIERRAGRVVRSADASGNGSSTGRSDGGTMGDGAWLPPSLLNTFSDQGAVGDASQD